MENLQPLAGGVEHSAVLAAYGKQAVPSAPCGRYGASLVLYKVQLWLFGGTDGGFRYGKDSKAGKHLSCKAVSKCHNAAVCVVASVQFVHSTRVNGLHKGLLMFVQVHMSTALLEYAV